MSALVETSRLFVALSVPEDVKLPLEAFRDTLRPHFTAPAVSWPRRENLHLTLRFLGNVAIETVSALKSVLEAVAADTAPMLLTAEGVGCFPNPRRPAVLWAGVTTNAGRLEKLHRNIVDGARAFTGAPAERDFAGHITLARFKRLRTQELERLKTVLREAARQRFGSWRAQECLLVRSELVPGGSRYTTLAKFQFCGRAAP